MADLQTIADRLAIEEVLARHSGRVQQRCKVPAGYTIRSQGAARVSPMIHPMRGGEKAAVRLSLLRCGSYSRRLQIRRFLRKVR